MKNLILEKSVTAIISFLVLSLVCTSSPTAFDVYIRAKERGQGVSLPSGSLSLLPFVSGPPPSLLTKHPDESTGADLRTCRASAPFLKMDAGRRRDFPPLECLVEDLIWGSNKSNGI
jgi:hypothetical protein